MVKRQNGDSTVSPFLSPVFSEWKNGKEKWIFISPHDDDVLLGAGILMQAAVLENIDMSILIVTDGSLGYTSVDQKERISAIRRKETIECYNSIGITDVIWLDFPDLNLNSYRGRMKAKKNDPGIIENYTGLQNAFTFFLRRQKPTRVFLPSSMDHHTDHKLVYQELMGALFHATSCVWQELGQSLKYFPRVYEMAIYSNFDGLPDIKVLGQESNLGKKIAGIEFFKSQENVIEMIAGRIRKNGPVEYFKEVNLNSYDPEIYNDIFKK
jgi:LmbE family N-acetylglucosaminyl deacetylase